MSEPTPGPGHNLDPLDLTDPRKLVDTEKLVPLFERHFAHLVQERDERVAGIARWVKAHAVCDAEGNPTGNVAVKDDADLADVIDYKTQLLKFASKDGPVDTARRQVKEPMLEGNQIAERWFVDALGGPVRDGWKIINAAAEAYMIEQRRKTLAAEAERVQKAQEQAEYLAAQARNAKSLFAQDDLMEQAVQAETEADRAREALAAPVVEATRVRGNLGTVSGLKTVWNWDVADLRDLLKAILDGKESIDLVVPNQILINRLLGKPTYRREIPGLRIFSVQKGR